MHRDHLTLCLGMLFRTEIHAQDFDIVDTSLPIAINLPKASETLVSQEPPHTWAGLYSPYWGILTASPLQCSCA